MKSFVTHTTTQPTVESLTDYYPFGMAMPGRSYNAYRYGFNSQENVPELGEGHTTALYWEYDGRLGRRWNVDPKTSFDVSAYATLANNPIFVIDVFGDICTESMRSYMKSTTDELRGMIDKQKDKIAEIQNEIDNLGSASQSKIARKYRKMNEEQALLSNLEGHLADMTSEFEKLENSNQVYNVVEDNSCYEVINHSAGGSITNENSRIIFNGMTGQVDIYIAPGMISSFAHESKHAYQFEMGFISLNVSRGSKFPLKGSSSTYYSKEDESEAFSRGEIFGQSENLSLDVYADLRDKREVNFINGKKDNLQGWVNVHKAAVRYDEKTYFFDLNPSRTSINSDK